MAYEMNGKHLLGKRIFLERKLLNMTLRELSHATGLSHSYISRIEKGSVQAEEKSLRPILDALSLPIYSDVEMEVEFRELYRTLYHKVLYVDYTGARKLYARMRARKTQYVNSPCFIEYYLVMLMTSLHTGAPLNEAKEYYQAAELLYDAMNKGQKDLFDVETSIYLSKTANKREAFQHLQNCLPRIEDDHLRGIGYYNMGCYISDDYTSFTESVEYLQKAQELFEEHANFQRSNRAKAVRQYNYIHMHRFELFRESYRETLAYAKQYGILDLYYFTKMNLARYYMVVEDYKAVIETLDSFTFQTAFYYVMKLYAYYVLDCLEEGKKLLRQYDKTHPESWTPLEEKFIAAMEYLMTKGRDDYALDRMKELTDEAFERHNFLMISMCVSLYSEMLKERRKYREAFRYAKKWLNVLKSVR